MLLPKSETGIRSDVRFNGQPLPATCPCLPCTWDGAHAVTAATAVQCVMFLASGLLDHVAAEGKVMGTHGCASASSGSGAGGHTVAYFGFGK